MDYLISSILVVVGLVNFVPVAGVLSAAALAKAYGIAPPSGDVAVLLRHRAALFGTVGGFIIASAFVPQLQLAAVVMAYVSMLSFVLLAGHVGHALTRVKKIDVVASLLLSVVPLLWLVGGLEG